MSLKLFGPVGFTCCACSLRLLSRVAGASLQFEADAGSLDRPNAIAEHRQARDHDSGPDQGRRAELVARSEHGNATGNQNEDADSDAGDPFATGEHQDRGIR